jgi:pimeloyl-ACP methyl ester carboxylesterase
MAFAGRDGVRLFYDEAGADGNGIPLLLVHGWTCFHGHFAPQVERFSAGRRVVSVDLRGHGRSDVAGPFTIETFGDDLAWLCERVGLDRPVVVGHSMGGQIAVHLAATRPDLVRAAVALDSPFAPAGSMTEGITAFLEALAGPDHLAARQDVMDSGWGPYLDRQQAAEIATVMLETPVEVAAEAITSVTVWDGEGALRSCTVPVLTVHAVAGSVTDSSRLVGDCKHLTVGQTVGAGHFMQLEVPDQVNAMIERFLWMISLS